MVHAVLYEARLAAYAGHPQELSAAIEDLDAGLSAAVDGVVDLAHPDREAAWSAF